MTEKIKNIYSIANGKSIELSNPLATKSRTCMNAATMDRISEFLAELLGTALLLFFGCSSCIVGLGPIPEHFVICLTFGLAVMLIVNIFGCISGSHLNPAVTVAATIYKLITPTQAAIYMAGQFIGGFVGFGVLKAITPAQIFRPENSTGPGLCTTIPNPDVSSLQAFTVEFIISAVLILICCAVWDPRNANHHDSVPLRFGLAITCLALVGGPYSGGSMNPARSLAPALWNGDFDQHWIYWLAPLLAAALTTPFYLIVFRRETPSEKPEKSSGEDFPLRTNNV